MTCECACFAPGDGTSWIDAPGHHLMYGNLRPRGSMWWSRSSVRLSREAAAILAQRDVGALPVVGSGGVIGMLTATDVIAARRPTASASK